MINFGPNFTLQTAISASRLDTFCFCSAKYAASYIYKIPDKGNDGANRGSVCHYILELLIQSKWRKLALKVIKKKSCKDFPALWRLVRIYAKQLKVDDEPNLEMINSFICVGIETALNELPEGKVEIIVEKPFDFEYINEEEEIKYRVRGFIDLCFLYEADGEKFVKLCDYKGSKGKFKKEKIENNVQSLIYQCVVSKLYPDRTLDSFKFIFLKFPKSPIQEAQVVSPGVLHGFELYLTGVQSQLEQFDISNSNDNIAYLDVSKKALCGTGAEGMKADGSGPIWICPARKPMEYWVEEKDGKIVNSYFEPGEGRVKKWYSGCSFFFDSEGKPQNLTFQ